MGQIENQDTSWKWKVAIDSQRIADVFPDFPCYLIKDNHKPFLYLRSFILNIYVSVETEFYL